MKIDQAIQYLETYKEQYGNLDILIDEVITKPNDPNFRKVVRHDCNIVVTTNENMEYIVSIHKKQKLPKPTGFKLGTTGGGQALKK